MAAPIRIAQVVGNMDGGVESVLMNYFRHIDRNRFLFDFFVKEGSSAASFSEIEALGGRIFVLPGYRNLPKYLSTTSDLFCQGRYPIVHTHVNTLSVFPLWAAKRAGIPVRIAHNHTTSSTAEFTRNIAKQLLRPAAGIFPTHRLACSVRAGEWLFGKHADFTVVQNAIDLDDFTFSPARRAQVRAELNISDDTFVVGFAGRLVTQKNVPFLIDVFHALQPMRPDSLLLLLGSGNLQKALMDKAQALGVFDKVRFLGSCRHVSQYMHAFDAFVMPSHYEGLGIAGIEAQALGLPCLFSDSLSNEVAVTDNASFLPLHASPQQWALHLASGLKRVDPDQSRLAPYDIKKEAPKLCDLYQSILDKI